MKKLFFTLFLVIIAASQLYCQVVEHSSSFNNNVGVVIDAQNNNVQSIHNNDFTPFAAPMPSQAPSGPMYVNPGEDPDEKDSVPVGSGALVLTLLGSAYFAVVGIRKNKKDKL